MTDEEKQTKRKELMVEMNTLMGGAPDLPGLKPGGLVFETFATAEQDRTPEQAAARAKFRELTKRARELV